MSQPLSVTRDDDTRMVSYVAAVEAYHAQHASTHAPVGTCTICNEDRGMWTD